nr:hypothetical protein [Candidatus Sigynarchaeota archaeon]
MLEPIEKHDDPTVKNPTAFGDQENASNPYERLRKYSYIIDPTIQLSHAAHGTVSGHEERAEPQHQGKTRGKVIGREGFFKRDPAY